MFITYYNYFLKLFFHQLAYKGTYFAWSLMDTLYFTHRQQIWTSPRQTAGYEEIVCVYPFAANRGELDPKTYFGSLTFNISNTSGASREGDCTRTSLVIRFIQAQDRSADAVFSRRSRTSRKPFPPKLFWVQSPAFKNLSFSCHFILRTDRFSGKHSFSRSDVGPVASSLWCRYPVVYHRTGFYLHQLL